MIEWYRYMLDCVAGFPRARFNTTDTNSNSNSNNCSVLTICQDSLNFCTAPKRNPKKTITLDAPGKQGRYVRMQVSQGLDLIPPTPTATAITTTAVSSLFAKILSTFALRQNAQWKVL
jgi:hypothetical protein